ncbi:MAG: hypothetical protein GF307_07210 [candidate division Zixibacteria bacterium]|nr:hypothetical protein [candidate division Zixibacteria bacterium]
MRKFLVLTAVLSFVLVSSFNVYACGEGKKSSASSYKADATKSTVKAEFADSKKSGEYAKAKQCDSKDYKASAKAGTACCPAMKAHYNKANMTSAGDKASAKFAGAEGKTCDASRKACSGDYNKASKASMPSKFANVYATDEDGNKYAVCVLSGKSFKVDSRSSYSVVDGKGYYHCCNGCSEPFKAEPSKYTESLEKNMKEASQRFADGERPGDAHM